MITFIIQARVGSTRLPNKILLPFYDGQSILDLLIEKLKEVEGTQIVIATSEHANCDAIQAVAEAHQVKCFRGSENDVLQRFIDAAEQFGSQQIVRVCSDNPFLELQGIRRLTAFLNANEQAYDYVGFEVEGVPSIKTHYGFWTEGTSLAALKKVAAQTDESLYHEHVTNYIYTHPSDFRIHWLETPPVLVEHKNIRLTIDTEQDFKLAQKIYSEIRKQADFPTIEDIVAYLEAHAEYYSLMEKQIRQNSK